MHYPRLSFLVFFSSSRFRIQFIYYPDMSEEQEISLIVLSHGLWGVKSHMGYIEKQLNEKYGDAVHIVKYK